MVRVLVYLYYRRKLVLVLAYNILLIYHVPSTKCVVINLALLARPLFGTVYIVQGCRKSECYAAGCGCSCP